MHRVPHRLLSLGLATALAASGVATTTVVGFADPVAAQDDTPWTLPTVPPRCTQTQVNSGNVAGCVILAASTSPEKYGWPAAPFPEPVPGDPLPWVNLAKGATGTLVAKVQTALVANGAKLDADGEFGTLTENAVKAFQQARGRPVTGVVDEATATLLGVQNTTFTFPPPGWNWLGWGYNGSPALAEWEDHMHHNPTAVGAVKQGQFAAMPEALPLFIGFLSEIQARGYVIRGGAGAYVFRCTASTRKDCNGLTRFALSNHAYGLATDINTVQNPMRTYYGVNGASACQTPMQTDMPQWLVQTAEKWGLYWGGYGWSSGCSSPSQVKTSASRDPMHFEFNGTPAQAVAILRFNMGDDACFEVAGSTGTITLQCPAPGVVPAAGTRTVVSTGAPAGATAALVNITSTGAAANGFLTAEPCGPAPDARTWSNSNARTGRATASVAVVPLDAQGRFCLYRSAAMHTIVDVQGFFTPAATAPNGNLFTPITAIRSVDTRVTPYCTPDSTCAPGPLPAGVEHVSTSEAPVGAVATLANLTAVAPAANGYITADSCAGLVPGPQTRSNLNFVAGDVVSNLAVAPSTATDQGVQFCSWASAGLHQLVDVQGYFAPRADGGLGFTAQSPTRLVDTRRCWADAVTGAERCGLLNPAGSIIRLAAPEGAASVWVNITTVQAQARGFVTAGACSTIRPGAQTSSHVNAVVGAAVSNNAVVPVDPDGTFCLYVSSAMHVAVDLAGTFSADGALVFLPVTPVRVHDTRRPA